MKMSFTIIIDVLQSEVATRLRAGFSYHRRFFSQHEPPAKKQPA